MGTTIATIDSAQVLDRTSFGNPEREMAVALSRYLPSFYRHAFRYLGNVADAEDAVQDALLSAHKHVGQFRGEARMSTWLTSIVINSARMQLRRRPRQTHVSLDEHPGPETYALSELLPDHRPSPAEQCLRSDLADTVVQLARQLSPTLRRAFQLRHLDGLTIREMTDILGVAEGTVKARVARARAKLRQLVRKNETRLAKDPR
jgi:RNA polymerase sigma-70 factor, ECF subfamily